MKRFFQIVAAVLIYGVSIGSLAYASDADDRVDQTAPDPLNATYRIEGQPVALVDGRGEVPAAPGSATKTKTAVQGRPVYGDLGGDGDEDAVLFLTHDPGGSGTFVYVAAAINLDGRYQVTNTIFLGDRITPMDVAIRMGMVVINYADRRPEEPMSTSPSAVKTMILILKDEQLIKMTPPGENGQIVEGWLTIGHEVRTFKPCDGEDNLWLMGQSPALNAIMAAYRRELSDQKNYRPLFMVLAGKQVKPPEDGFGAEYDAAFLATRLVRVTPGASCTNMPQDIDSANAYMHKITFDTSTLDEEGLYGPTVGKRALSYEFCIPNTIANRTEVERVDPTVTFFEQSPGRIGCGTNESLCIGSTHQKNFATVLQQLAELPYVQRIDESFFE